MKTAGTMSQSMRLGCKAGLVMFFLLINGWVCCAASSLAEDNRQKNNILKQSVAIETLAQLRGRIYLAERNRLIQSQPGLSKAAQAYLRNETWQLRIQAKIIQGWMADQGFYRNLLSEIDAVDFEWQRKTRGGISIIWDRYVLLTQREYHQKILPLSWEVIIKFHDTWPRWKVLIYLSMIGAAPVEESIEPVLYLLEETEDRFLKSAAGETLAKLPREAVNKRLKELETKHRAVLQAIQGTRDRFE